MAPGPSSLSPLSVTPPQERAPAGPAVLPLDPGAPPLRPVPDGPQQPGEALRAAARGSVNAGVFGFMPRIIILGCASFFFG